MQESDSDDYFTDDIVLDEKTLAVLDEEENKFISQSARPLHVPPATKRQKTDQGWKPGLGNHRTESLDDLDDLPEISVHRDGTYGLGGARHFNAVSSNDWNIGSVSSSHTGVLAGINQGQPGHPRRSSTISPHTGGLTPLQSSGRITPSHEHNPLQSRPLQRQASNGHASRRVPNPGVSHAQVQRIASQTTGQDSVSSHKEVDLEALRQQMEEVCLVHSLDTLSKMYDKYIFFPAS